VPEQEPKPKSDAPQQTPSDEDKSRRMEEAQEQAAEERRDEGGYQ
jgi:hypothetical protein